MDIAMQFIFSYFYLTELIEMIPNARKNMKNCGNNTAKKFHKPIDILIVGLGKTLYWLTNSEDMKEKKQ